MRDTEEFILFMLSRCARSWCAEKESICPSVFSALKKSQSVRLFSVCFPSVFSVLKKSQFFSVCFQCAKKRVNLFFSVCFTWS